MSSLVEKWEQYIHQKALIDHRLKPLHFQNALKKNAKE
jgi:hypothetical protein